MDKPQDDSDVLNRHVPKTAPNGQEAWVTPPRTHKVSFSDQGAPSPPPSPTKVAPPPRSTPMGDSSNSQLSSTLPNISTSLTDSKEKVSSPADKAEHRSKDIAMVNKVTADINNDSREDATYITILSENDDDSGPVKKEVVRTGSVLSSQEVQEQTIFIPDEIIAEDETSPDKTPPPQQQPPYKHMADRQAPNETPADQGTTETEIEMLDNEPECYDTYL